MKNLLLLKVIVLLISLEVRASAPQWARDIGISNLIEAFGTEQSQGTISGLRSASPSSILPTDLADHVRLMEGIRSSNLSDSEKRSRLQLARQNLRDQGLNGIIRNIVIVPRSQEIRARLCTRHSWRNCRARVVVDCAGRHLQIPESLLNEGGQGLSEAGTLRFHNIVSSLLNQRAASIIPSIMAVNGSVAPAYSCEIGLTSGMETSRRRTRTGHLEVTYLGASRRSRAVVSDRTSLPIRYVTQRCLQEAHQNATATAAARAARNEAPSAAQVTPQTPSEEVEATPVTRTVRTDNPDFGNMMSGKSILEDPSIDFSNPNGANTQAAIQAVDTSIIAQAQDMSGKENEYNDAAREVAQELGIQSPSFQEFEETPSPFMNNTDQSDAYYRQLQARAAQLFGAAQSCYQDLCSCSGSGRLRALAIVGDSMAPGYGASIGFTSLMIVRDLEDQGEWGPECRPSQDGDDQNPTPSQPGPAPAPQVASNPPPQQQQGAPIK